jgi:hypothetical protein
MHQTYLLYFLLYAREFINLNFMFYIIYYLLSGLFISICGFDISLQVKIYALTFFCAACNIISSKLFITSTIQNSNLPS